MRVIVVPLLYHTALLIFGLAALLVLSQWNSDGWPDLTAAGVIDALSSIQKSRFTSVVLIPAMLSGMICFGNGGRIFHAGVISIYSASVAGAFLAGTGFVLIMAAAAGALAMIGFLQQRARASNKSVQPSADAPAD